MEHSHLEIELARSGDRPVLALRPKDAAKALGLGERLLWTLTDRGQIPHCRVGRVILYPIDGLRTWLAEHSKVGETR